MKKENFLKALVSLETALSTAPTEERDYAGIIKNFEFVYELTWKCLKEKLAQEGHEASSARDVFKKGYQLGFLNDEESWLQIIQDRNNTVHTYNAEFAHLLYERIKSSYLPLFQNIRTIL